MENLLKTHKIVYANLGCNVYTSPQPIKLYDPEIHTSEFLEQEYPFCISNDNDMLVMDKKYSLIDVTLPTWLSPEDFIHNHVRWQYLWGDHRVNALWPENCQRFLLRQKNSVTIDIYVNVLRAVRSKFMLSLKDQLLNWLNTPEEDRKYDQPLSNRQLESLYKNVHYRRQAEIRFCGGVSVERHCK